VVVRDVTVLVCAGGREGRSEVFKHILVPLDGSEYSERAVEPARSLAEQYSARLTLLTVMVRFPASRLHIARLDQGSEERGRQYLEEVRATQLGTASVSVDTVVPLGTPAESIAEFASHAAVDLIVMSTHGTASTGRVRHTLGSTAWKILQDAPCPVLLIPIH
jgi:nucleotide-binding universal stress UspA family protein